MAKDFSIDALLKASTDYNYLPSFTPSNTVSNSPFVTRSAELFRQAGLLADKHEHAYMGESATLSPEDFTALAQAHNSLAQAHYQLAQDMKVASPVVNIKAVSANGDAYGAHLDAAKICLQNVNGTPQSVDFLIDNRNANSNASRQVDRGGVGDSPIKDAWLSAHRAFVMSRMAHNEALFATAR